MHIRACARTHTHVHKCLGQTSRDQNSSWAMKDWNEGNCCVPPCLKSACRVVQSESKRRKEKEQRGRNQSGRRGFMVLEWHSIVGKKRFHSSRVTLHSMVLGWHSNRWKTTSSNRQAHVERGRESEQSQPKTLEIRTEDRNMSRESCISPQ